MGKLILAGLAAVILLFAGCSTFTTVDATEIGIQKRFGQVQSETLPPGLHMVNPFSTSVDMMDTSNKRWDHHTDVYTGDIQTATVAFTLNYHLDAARAIPVYLRARNDWASRFIPPIAERTVKDEFGRWTASRAVAARPQIQTNIENRLRQHLAASGIILDDFNMTNIDYSDAYEHAVEQAQVATQQAIASQNATVRIREEATQRVIRATSEAEAIRVQANAISTNPAIVQMRAIERWNGQLCPEGSNTCIIGSGQNSPMPFINVGGH